MLPKRNQEEFEKVKEIVENPDFKTPADVEVFFEAYTKYIWDYKMVGTIYDHYNDETIVHGENGINMSNIDAVVGHTVERLYTLPDLTVNFIEICAHKVSDDEFKFIQVTYPEGTFTGPSKFGEPNGEKLSYGNIMNMCECLVQRVNGVWKITEEWGLIGYDNFFKVGGKQ